MTKREISKILRPKNRFKIETLVKGKCYKITYERGFNYNSLVYGNLRKKVFTPEQILQNVAYISEDKKLIPEPIL